MTKNKSSQKGNGGFQASRTRSGAPYHSPNVENPNKGDVQFSRVPNPKKHEFVVDPNDFPSLGDSLNAKQVVCDTDISKDGMNSDMVNPTISSISGNASGCNKFTIEDVESKFEVSLKSKVEIEAFANGLEAGTYPNWFLLSNDVKDIFTELVCKRHTELSSIMNSNQVPSASDTIVESVEVDKPCHSEKDPIFDGVNISLPRRVVKKVESRLEHTLYGYFLGQRLAFPVVEYFAKNNWAKHGLKRIMMNNKGFFFFKFESRAGLDAVLEGGPWLIRKTPIILKTWTVGTRLLKEEMSRIPIWVKFHDVPIQAFEEEGINLIASFLGKPIMFDSFTNAMCKESWGRSSFARCLIEVNSDTELVDVITIGVPSLMSDDFTKETIRVEYEWKPPRCDTCKIFGHTIDHCPLNVGSATNVNTSNVVNPHMESVNDGFQKVTKKKKNRGKSKSAAGYKMVGPTMRYEPKAPKNDLKKIPPSSAASGSAHQNNTSNVDSVGKSSSDVQNMSQVTSPNSFSALAHEVEDEVVENIYDESANILNLDDSS